MQQAQKTTAEAKAQRRARFHLKAEAGVVKPQLGNGVAQLFEVVRIHGEQSAEYNRLNFLEAGQRRWRGVLDRGNGVADHRLRHFLAQRGDEADFDGSKLSHLLRSEERRVGTEW